MTEPWTAAVVTLYPEMFPGPLGHSLAGRALDNDLWRLKAVDMRVHGIGRHRQVDDTPSGGGPGMVLRADVVAAALAEAAEVPGPKLCLTPRGVPVTQTMIRDFAAGPGLTLLCGRFEGIDQRVIDARDLVEVSLGDIVLSGGEPAALALLDAVVRLLPGVMGKERSGDEESFEDGLLEYPHYTRPQVFEGQEIPAVLTSGDHGAVAEWRRQERERTTRERRPDLWQKYCGEGVAKQKEV